MDIEDLAEEIADYFGERKYDIEYDVRDRYGISHEIYIPNQSYWFEDGFESDDLHWEVRAMAREFDLGSNYGHLLEDDGTLIIRVGVESFI